MDAKRRAYTQWTMAKDNVKGLLEEWDTVEHNFKNMEHLALIENRLQLNIISAVNALHVYNYLKKKRNRLQ